MPTFPFMQVDAFTDRPLGGNPCAIVFDADALDDATMLAIAREMNLSETSFVVRSSVADVGARYFTPAEEIPMAGHPTIATIFALIESGRLALAGDLTTVMLELRVGPIRVDIQASQGVVQQIIMTQKKPQFLATYAAAEVLPAFGLAPEDLLPNVPIQTVSTGTPQLMIALRDHAALQRIRLNIAGVRAAARCGRFLQPACVLPGWRDAGRPDVRAPLRAAARRDGRSVHRLGHRRHGGVLVALRPAARPALCGRAGPLDAAARPGECRAGWAARRYRERAGRRPGGDGAARRAGALASVSWHRHTNLKDTECV